MGVFGSNDQPYRTLGEFRGTNSFAYRPKGGQDKDGDARELDPSVIGLCSQQHEDEGKAKNGDSCRGLRTPRAKPNNSKNQPRYCEQVNKAAKR